MQEAPVVPQLVRCDIQSTAVRIDDTGWDFTLSPFVAGARPFLLLWRDSKGSRGGEVPLYAYDLRDNRLLPVALSNMSQTDRFTFSADGRNVAFFERWLNGTPVVGRLVHSDLDAGTTVVVAERAAGRWGFQFRPGTSDLLYIDDPDAANLGALRIERGGTSTTQGHRIKSSIISIG